MTRVILERSFDPPLTDSMFERIRQRLKPCLDRSSARWIRSCFSRDRQRLICEFDAPDAEAVRTALRRARLEFDRTWSADVLGPEPAASGDEPTA